MHGIEAAYLLFLGVGGHVKLEEDDVTVLHHVVLAFLPILTRLLDSGLRPILLELIDRIDLRLDEAALEVGVDDACSLRRLRRQIRQMLHV